MKELEKMLLYVTGIVIINTSRRDKNQFIKKNKEMRRGDFVPHLYEYYDTKNKKSLVCWKYRDIFIV